jgi:hypothetical protein
LLWCCYSVAKTSNVDVTVCELVHKKEKWSKRKTGLAIV